MSDPLRFDGRVAVVTGAGGGLGRAHALLLASRGCKVVVNDLGGAATGGGKSSAAADKVVQEIKAAGGEAVANYDSVEDGAKIIQTALDTWKRIDIVINNAGILRDVSFQKMTQEDWDLIFRVHVLGAFRVTHAAWNHMRDAGYGRIVFTASAAGIYGNFGQANYSAAKLGLLGLSNTLAIEGRKKNVLSNTIAPLAGSRLTETVLPKELVEQLKPEFVSPLVAYLCHESSEENGGLFEVGAGFFAKLRWERTEGKSFKLGRAFSIDDVASNWSAIADFSKSTHPTDINASMQPLVANVSAKSKGGNEFIDLDQALGYEFPPIQGSYAEKDLALYALSVGAARDPLDDNDLRLVYEMHSDGIRAIPTFGVTPAISAILEQAKKGVTAPGLNYGFERILHGEQYTEVTRPLPPNAKLTHRVKIKDIWDKGKNAVVVSEILSYDESGDLLIRNEASMFVRGAGGWGGERGPAGDANAAPTRAPDATVEEKTYANQALLYRLSSGDWNPLHADPSFASAFGFDKPILHGLCTFGFATRHVLNKFAKGDPRYFKSVKVRFAETVYPGETLITDMWKESDTRILFRTKVKERDKVVISNAAVELYKEIPQSKARAAAGATASAAPASAPAAASPSAPAAASGEPTSADVFWGIRNHVATTPDLAAKIQTVFQFKLTNPDSVQTLDLKNGKGALIEGAGDVKPDVTLELSDEDFHAMAMGKANPQKLYFGGKLKISGNVMASQKLDFLTKIDPEKTRQAMVAAGYVPGGGASASAPPGAKPSPAAAPASDGGELNSGDVFVSIRDHIERHPELVAKIGTTFQFKLTNPDTGWLVDLKNGTGGVTPGVAEKADCTLELSNADFMDMTSGKADAQKLYFGGKLKISGNIMASQKLTFLKSIDPEQARSAIMKARASGAGAAAAQTTAPAKSGAHAAAIFKALADRISKTPALVSEVGAVMQFQVTDPDGAWTVDLKNGKGGVTEGKAALAETTFRLTDSDLLDLCKGHAAGDLHQRGQLRVDGDVRPAQKLGFLKGLAG